MKISRPSKKILPLPKRGVSRNLRPQSEGNCARAGLSTILFAIQPLENRLFWHFRLGLQVGADFRGGCLW